MNFIRKILYFFKWLFSKASEVKDLRQRDVLLAELVLKIQNQNSGIKFIIIPLFSIKQIHSIDRESALKKLNERRQKFEPYKHKFVKGGIISNSFLESVLPSITPIKVIKMNKDLYTAFEGNGRLIVLQQIFTKEDTIKVEVELYEIEEKTKIQKLAKKIIRANNIR